MRVGLLSDIHGELNGLEKALGLLDDLGIDHIVCAGDLVNGSGHNDMVVALIRERNIPCVMGNHDRDAPQNDAFIRQEEDTANPRFRRWLLKPATLEFLKALPRTKELTIGEHSILLTHSNMKGPMAYIYADSHPNRFTYILDEHPVDLVVMGHTHVPMHVKIHNSHIVNPGSVYRNRTGNMTQSCGIFDFETMQLTVLDLRDGKPLPYDKASFDEPLP